MAGGAVSPAHFLSAELTGTLARFDSPQDEVLQHLDGVMPVKAHERLRSHYVGKLALSHQK